MALHERKMDDLRWDDLRVFLAVAERGTLAAAGASLGVDASTVHRRVAALEASLSARLFDRDPRGYALTPVGEALWPKAREVEEAVLAARRAVSGHDQAASGVVRLTLPESLLDLLAPHLAAFHARCPGVLVSVSSTSSAVDLGREADVALRASPAAPEDAVARRVGEVAWCVYAADGAPDAWVAYAGMDDVAAVRWWRAQHGGAPVALAVDTVTAMQRALGGALGRGLLPCYLGDRDPRLARDGDPVPEAETPLWLLVHVDLRRAARVRALVDFLAPRLAEAAVALGGAEGPAEWRS